MKRVFFWSPHIDPQVATFKSVTNSMLSLIKYSSKFEVSILNVFGEWDDFVDDKIFKINLIKSRFLIKRRFKGFFRSRFLYLMISLLSFNSLVKILRNKKPDFMIIHLITSLPLIIFLLNNFNTKLILRISGLPKLNFLRRFLWKVASKKITYVICPTQETKNQIASYKIFEDEKLIFLPDPIIEVKKISEKKNEPIIEKFEKPFFLSVGRFTKQKNHLFLINFFSKNQHYLNDHKLIIIGDGELERVYKKEIKNQNLNNKIKILNFKKNIFNYIKTAKCIFSSSLWEDPGFIMIESAFIGTPVISSDCPNGPKEFINDNRNGFIYKSNDEKSFQEQLDKFFGITNDKLFEKIKSAKKRSKMYTTYNNYKKLSYLLN